MDSVRGRAVRRGIARLLAVCAVLFGLFLMHGAPATAAEGCHGAMSDTAALPLPPMTGMAPMTGPTPVAGGQDVAPMSTVTAPDTHGAGPAVRAADTSGMSGVHCVSTPAQERVPLPAPGLLAVAGAGALALGAAAGLRAAVRATGRRGPPAGGRDLLLQVCIART
ncbi:hypothetical protein GCM10014715_11850 [Streptomyces spiralis]|uniref:Secreted protein n=1 Tax=Streptomyces spiralis TaxID=66376 RepID=A0A918ZN56_9ACTN|nr:hypothetical protein [Streptomyces spiralis]GHE60064.1 hypothetical protein GCM10014715_11850 [Streptomyces spiralis]